MHKNLLKLLFPTLCFGCNELLLNNEKIICSSCLHNLPITHHHFLESNDTKNKFYGIVDLEFASSMLYFHKEGIVQKLIHQLKYKGKQEIGTFLGTNYAITLKETKVLTTIDEIIPVPLHKKRLKERTYNQVDTFCIALSSELNIPYNKTLLIRNEYSKTQTKKNKLQRQEINTNLFDITQTVEKNGYHFLLVDDVITTGATIESCAKALLKIPNSKVSVITMAYTQS
ncbi:Amidophosphoribosyltransferase [Flavobacterium sp. 9AF]|uniref:ComF family protein n=1 Tax=Flavobacterium sp. 9AF TaxID=2653142 RepID=UPI0012F0E8B5|nr:ComF family protein [Flavobacterium sp. 9AF]VXB39026.1 Amidophosphoribosyltransferase [Flavobacterium sp. 9AF]